MDKFPVFLLLFALVSCDSTSIGNLPVDSLEFYVESAKNSDFSRGTDVLAFAGGGNLQVSDVPVSVYYHPVESGSDVALWESDGTDINPDNFLEYRRTDAETRDLFKGTLKRFLSNLTDDRWVIVTYLTEQTYHVSAPIRIEAEQKPSESSPDRASVAISNGVPAFSWQDGIYPDNARYVAIVSSLKGDFYAGVTTEQSSYRYGDTASIVDQLGSGTGIPVLPGNSDFLFTLMGLSEDGWMQLYSIKQFSTP